MSLFRGLIDRLSLVFLIVVAGAAPSFVTQYQQQMDGRLDQVRTDLAPFQAIADARHDGSLDALVDHHLASSDATFRDEGSAILAMMRDEARLAEASASLDTNLYGQLWYLGRFADTEVMTSTWSLFEPSFSFTGEGLVFALIVGGLGWLLLFGCAAGAGRLFRSARYRKGY